jgi:hypothetical protein
MAAPYEKAVPSTMLITRIPDKSQTVSAPEWRHPDAPRINIE